ncbi:glycosyltransferase family 2 protein [Lactobacillus gallinarum]|uniref:glycosyltransferase family 2 protein n=1 Tax=Lactobacillus gallinarum TaxID=52242 RepID=UPI0024B06A65|nr:glycosyltransferase family 2 protein [Lactobacillus gallinarum]
MSKNLKVSVVMPTYNNENDVGQAIESVIEQTYSNWELIIVNDGSSDNTYNICQKYAQKDKRIKVYTQCNKGPSVARNNALKKASGDLLMFVDADDTLVKNALSILIPYFDDSLIDLCIYSWNEISLKGKKFHRYSQAEISAKKEDYFRNIGYSSDWNMFSGGYPWNKIWRISSLKRGGMVYFNEHVNMLEDRLFVLAAIDKINGLKVINTPLYNYYVRNESISHSKSNKEILQQAEEICNAVKFEYKYIKKNHSSAIDVAQKSLFQVQVNYLTVAILNQNLIDKKVFIKIKNEFNNGKFYFLNFKVFVKYVCIKIYLYFKHL